MIKRFQAFFSLSLALFLCSYSLASNRVIVYGLRDFDNTLEKEGTTFVVKTNIDLDGRILRLPNSSKVIFKDGCFVNGTIEGNETTVVPTTANVFKNCIIKGKWRLKCAYSSMFDSDMDAMVLFKNLSCLSPRIKLFANRRYFIKDVGNVIKVESIGSAEKQKPVLEFHTTDPNVVGLLLLGDNIELSNLIIKDDYDKTNDAVYGYNDITNGSTIGIQSDSKTVNRLRIVGCEFSGGASSSYIASSQVKDCQVSNCSFSGYLSDHAVYCSTQIESFTIRNCIINDITHSAGLFKIRSSRHLKHYSLCNISGKNINGYLSVISLLETPRAKIVFDNISLTKDAGDESVFYGFCVTDETRSLAAIGGLNAGNLIVSNCHFGYGYKGASLIYHGSGERACIDRIIFLNTYSCESNFGGVFSNTLLVKNCSFNNCCTDKGIYIASHTVELSNTTINRGNNYSGGCVFLVNYAHNYVNKVQLKKVSIDVNASYLFKICGGTNLMLYANKCDFSHLSSSIFYVQNGLKINTNLRRIKLSEVRDFQERSFFD